MLEQYNGPTLDLAFPQETSVAILFTNYGAQLLVPEKECPFINGHTHEDLLWLSCFYSRLTDQSSIGISLPYSHVHEMVRHQLTAFETRKNVKVIDLGVVSDIFQIAGSVACPLFLLAEKDIKVSPRATLNGHFFFVAHSPEVQLVYNRAPFSGIYDTDKIQ